MKTMKKESSITSRMALALWLGSAFLIIWLIFSVVITWCTAKAMDRYLEKENGQIASNVINAARLQRLAEDPDIQDETIRLRLQKQLCKSFSIPTGSP